MPRLRAQHGQGLVEYALLLILIAILVLVILAVFGGQVGNLFSRVTNGINGLP
jgi:pilus assembly protein Flp/PilA